MPGRGGRRRQRQLVPVMAVLVRLATDEAWTAESAAVRLRQEVPDDLHLQWARCRINGVLWQRPSAIAERCALTLDAALGGARARPVRGPGPR